tara:strand:+ start:1361 stop:1591 length:231 start_codon:yes stop_codon:yes gene_type:complete
MTYEYPTEAQIAQHYSAAMDSVNLINDLMAQDTRNPEEQDRVDRNVEHLNLIVVMDFWTTEDLTPLHDAIANGTPG